MESGGGERWDGVVGYVVVWWWGGIVVVVVIVVVWVQLLCGSVGFLWSWC